MINYIFYTGCNKKEHLTIHCKIIVDYWLIIDFKKTKQKNNVNTITMNIKIPP